MTSEKRRFADESKILEQLFIEDDEWIYKWVEYVSSGEMNKAKFIKTQIRPNILSRINTQMKITLDAMEKLCQTKQNE